MMYHFQFSVSDLFDYALRDCGDSDMVGITITNTVNVQDKAIGLTFRRKKCYVLSLTRLLSSMQDLTLWINTYGGTFS
jgi:hypothetical protein